MIVSMEQDPAPEGRWVFASVRRKLIKGRQALAASFALATSYNRFIRLRKKEMCHNLLSTHKTLAGLHGAVGSISDCRSGHFLPFQQGQNLAPYQMPNSLFFSKFHHIFAPKYIMKKKKEKN